jgi:hypothetical protein
MLQKRLAQNLADNSSQAYVNIRAMHDKFKEDQVLGIRKLQLIVPKVYLDSTFSFRFGFLGYIYKGKS